MKVAKVEQENKYEFLLIPRSKDPLLVAEEVPIIISADSWHQATRKFKALMGYIAEHKGKVEFE